MIVLKAYRQENGLLYLKLKSGTYKIDGQIVKIDREQEVIIEETSKVEMVSVCSYISHYQHLENPAKTITTVEHLRMKQELEAVGHSGEVDIDDEHVYGLSWRNIKDRHAYELFLHSWKPIHGEELIAKPILIEIEGQAPVAHPHITPIRKLGGDLTNTLYRYSEAGHAVSIVVEELSKAGLSQLEQEPPSFGVPKDGKNTFYIKGGSIQFSRIFVENSTGAVEGHYLSSVIRALKEYESSRLLSGTFAELEAKYKSTDILIRIAIRSYLNRNLQLKVLGPTVGLVLANLNNILKNVLEIEPMKKSHDDHRRVIKSINDLITTIHIAVDKEIS